MNISTWLHENGLGEFVEVFEKQAITQEMLATLTDADLLAMGLDKLGDRKRILVVIGKRESAGQPETIALAEVTQKIGDSSTQTVEQKATIQTALATEAEHFPAPIQKPMALPRAVAFGSVLAACAALICAEEIFQVWQLNGFVIGDSHTSGLPSWAWIKMVGLYLGIALSAGVVFRLRRRLFHATSLANIVAIAVIIGWTFIAERLVMSLGGSYVVAASSYVVAAFVSLAKAPETDAKHDSTRDADRQAAEVFDCLQSCIFKPFCMKQGGVFRCGYPLDPCMRSCRRNATSDAVWRRGATKFDDIFTFRCDPCGSDFLD